MTSRELVKKTIIGENDTGITPLYGWVSINMPEAIAARYGSVEAFEDLFRFDMAHIFGGPYPYDTPELNKLMEKKDEITPEMLLNCPLRDPNRMEDYQDVVAAIKHHNERDRFCYMQTNGIFECLNGGFGIENHLCHMAEYPDELDECYKRQAKWNLQFINNVIDLGIDMVHISDDWGAQNSLMFSPNAWRKLIFPRHKEMVDAIHDRGVFASLHSDGNVSSVLDGIADIGFDAVHPYQESAGMSYDVYLDRYQDKFAILGGLCVQTTIGFNDYARLESEIRRVFDLLKGKRWMFCTTHFVQEHCSMDELDFAFRLARELADKRD